MATPVGLKQSPRSGRLRSRTHVIGAIDPVREYLKAPAPDIARLEAENRLLKIENQTLHGWIAQQDEFIERLTSAARRKT
jgi:hypothetical protein